MMSRRLPVDAMEVLDCSDAIVVDDVCVVLVLVVVSVEAVVVRFSSLSRMISMISTAVYFDFPE